jgi:hypothetical protein
MNPDMLNLPAVFSPDRKHRYTLKRRWWSDPPGQTVAFIGLNPSTADETQDDPTVRRCINFAKTWGYNAMFMLNIFALRSTDPLALYRAKDPVGPWNDDYILKAVEDSSLVIACWGNHGALLNRGWTVIRLLEDAGVKLMRLGAMTQVGQPRHPLYLKGDLKPGPL